MAEKWDLVDIHGNKNGHFVLRTNRDQIPQEMFHLCVEVWVKVGNKLLITKRHPNKSEGLKYDCPGGAVLSGEAVLDGAIRELIEETGIVAEKERFVLLGHTISHPVYATSYLLCLDSLPDLTLQPTEVVGYKLVSIKELDGMEEQLTKGTYRRYLLYKDIIFSEQGR